MLISEGGHHAHLTLFGNEITPMSKTTFYFVIAILVLIDIVQSRYQAKLLAANDAAEGDPAAHRAGAVLRRRFRAQAPLVVEAKGLHDFVTEIDREAESAAVSFIEAEFPDHVVMSEEAWSSGRAQRASSERISGVRALPAVLFTAWLSVAFRIVAGWSVCCTGGAFQFIQPLAHLPLCFSTQCFSYA